MKNSNNSLALQLSLDDALHDKKSGKISEFAASNSFSVGLLDGIDFHRYSVASSSGHP